MSSKIDQPFIYLFIKLHNFSVLCYKLFKTVKLFLKITQNVIAKVESLDTIYVVGKIWIKINKNWKS